MRRLFILAAALSMCAAAAAGELDNQNTMPADQAQAAKLLPKTTVVRYNRKTHKIEIAQLPYRLQKGRLPKGLKFSEVALNAQFSAATNNDKDVNLTSSTSAFGFNYGPRYGHRGGYGHHYPYRGGYGRYPYDGGYRHYPYAGGYGPGYAGGGYGYFPYNEFNNGWDNYYPYSYAGCAQYSCGPWAYPTYVVAYYTYVYRPYWGYARGPYDYYYCGGPGIY